jgi:hypothetical protein
MGLFSIGFFAGLGTCRYARLNVPRAYARRILNTISGNAPSGVPGM